MATTQSPKKGKRTFIVHSGKFGVLTNWREVEAAHLEGRRIEAQPHYFEKGDRIALSEEYIAKRNIAKLFSDEALDRDGLPAIEPIEMYEKRLAIEAKLAEAAQAENADKAKLDAERREEQRKLQEEFNDHSASAWLEEFSP